MPTGIIHAGREDTTGISVVAGHLPFSLGRLGAARRR